MAEVAQAGREAVREAQRALWRAGTRHLPVEWQQKLALWVLHAEVALPSAKLILARVVRWLEARLGVAFPRQLPSIPAPVLLPVLLLCLRFPRMLLKQIFVAGLASVVFYEDCDICCETRASIAMVSNGCGHRCCRQCLAAYLETNLSERMARMRHARTYNIRCFGGCEERLDRRLALVGCPELRPFLRQLRRREDLISRCPEGTQWVECPGASCVSPTTMFVAPVRSHLCSPCALPALSLRPRRRRLTSFCSADCAGQRCRALVWGIAVSSASSVGCANTSGTTPTTASGVGCGIG